MRRHSPAQSGCLLPSTESCSLFGLPALFPSRGWKGSQDGRGFLHRAVLSVSLSISNRTWPGRSLLAEPECVSGKTLRSGSDTLELASGQKTQEMWYQYMVMPKRPPKGARRGREAGECKSPPMHTHSLTRGTSSPWSSVKPLRPPGQPCGRAHLLPLLVLSVSVRQS